MVVFGGPQGSGKGDAATSNGLVGGQLLDAGQLLIAGMRRTTGSGDPEQGEVFGQAALQFGGAEQTVSAAVPGADWEGGAARAYAERNRRQADRAASMAVLDRGVQTVIAREAQQVRHHRENLDSQADHLATLRRTTESIALIPGVGEALKAAVELTAVNAALSTGTTELHQLAREVDENASALQQIADEYAVLAEQPTTAGDVSPPTQPRGPADPPPADAAPPVTDALAASGSALGVVGAAIGAVVAPVAAALSGVAGAAGQTLGMLSSAGATAAPEAIAEAPSAEEQPAADEVDAQRREDGRDAASEQVVTGVDTPVIGSATESEGQELDRPDKLDPAEPPAATRPPQF